MKSQRALLIIMSIPRQPRLLVKAELDFYKENKSSQIILMIDNFSEVSIAGCIICRT
jgi:hypothetical protein